MTEKSLQNAIDEYKRIIAEGKERVKKKKKPNNVNSSSLDRKDRQVEKNRKPVIQKKD